MWSRGVAGRQRWTGVGGGGRVLVAGARGEVGPVFASEAEVEVEIEVDVVVGWSSENWWVSVA